MCIILSLKEASNVTRTSCNRFSKESFRFALNVILTYQIVKECVGTRLLFI